MTEQLIPHYFSHYESSTTQTPKPDRDITKKMYRSDIPQVHVKSLHRNTRKSNPSIYKKDNISGPSEVCPGNAKLV